MTAGPRSRYAAAGVGAAIVIGIVTLLQVVIKAGLVSSFLVPPPSDVAAAFPALITDERLFVRLGQTTLEATAAAVIAIMVGGAAGWALYRSRDAWLAFNSWVTALNATPLILLYPLLLVLFGRNWGTIVVIGALSALPPIILKTREAFAATRPVLLDVGRSLNLNRRQQFWLIHLPAAAPTILSGVRLGVFYALVAVIGAEFLTGVGGLGALVPDLADRYKMASVFGVIFVVIVTSATIVSLIRRVERWLRPA